MRGKLATGAARAATTEKPPVILAVCAYQEEAIIYDFLEKSERLDGLALIHILDGPWKNHDFKETKSSDRMKDWIEAYARRHPARKVQFVQEDRLYRTEGEKRNWQLEILKAQYPQASVLILDCDEEIRFANGLDKIDVRAIAAAIPQSTVGEVMTYGKGGAEGYRTPRFIPPWAHYHTERSMIMHDRAGKTISNYHPGENFSLAGKTWNVDDFFIVNNWTAREQARNDKKAIYWQHLDKLKTEKPPCDICGNPF